MKKMVVNRRSFECCLLGSLGFSSELIAKKTGLSVNQVNYRLFRAQISRREYTNGRSVVSHNVLERTAELSHKFVKGRIQKMLNNGHRPL